MRSVLAKQPAIGGFTTLTATLGGGGLLLSFDVPASWTQGAQSSGLDGDGFQFTTWDGLVDPVLGPIAVEATLRTKPVPEGVVRPRRTCAAGCCARSSDTPQHFAPPDVCAGPARRGEDPGRRAPRQGLRPRLRRPRAGAGGHHAGGRTSGVHPGAPEAGAGDEPLFWEWELAVPPESCPYNTGCNSAAVHFVSLAVVGGQLCWLDLKLTSEAAYRNAAGQLRRARTSFTAAPAPPAPPPERGAPQADAAVIVAAP